MEKKKQNPPTASSRNRASKLFIQYAGMGFDMLVRLGVAVFAGYELDRWCHWGWPVFLIIFPLVALGLFLWRLIKATGKKDG